MAPVNETQRPFPFKIESEIDEKISLVESVRVYTNSGISIIAHNLEPKKGDDADYFAVQVGAQNKHELSKSLVPAFLENGIEIDMSTFDETASTGLVLIRTSTSSQRAWLFDFILDSTPFAKGVLYHLNSDPARPTNRFASQLPPVPYHGFPRGREQPNSDFKRHLTIREWAFSWLSVPNMLKTIESLSALDTRAATTKTGRLASEMFFGECHRLKGQFGGRYPQRVDIRMVHHSDVYPKIIQPSVEVVIEGKKRVDLTSGDPEDFVVIGAHLDCKPTSNAPGASDNASGVAVCLELLRIILQLNITFEYTVAIHAYANEESGMTGSQALSDLYSTISDPHPRRVHAVVGVDMALYKYMDTLSLEIMHKEGDVRLAKQLFDLAKLYPSINDSHFSVSMAGQFLSGASSDHHSWHVDRYSAVSLTQPPSQVNIALLHSEHDSLDMHRSSSEQLGHFARLGLAYLIHYAGGEVHVSLWKAWCQLWWRSRVQRKTRRFRAADALPGPAQAHYPPT